MRQTRVLITVKTAPLLSASHIETVCTAGLRRDGKWIRIYPIPFRLLDASQRFKKYQWIEAPLKRDTRDPRPESHKLVGDITLLHHLNTKDNWQERKRAVLKRVYTNLTTLINEARDTSVSTSLATFKPTRIVRFHVERASDKQAYLERKRLLRKELDERSASNQMPRSSARKRPYAI